MPADFGWVTQEWVLRLFAYDSAKRAYDAATPEDKPVAWEVMNAAQDRLWEFKEQMADGLMRCLRMALEVRPDQLRGVVGLLLAETVGEQTDPLLAVLRGRVAALEKSNERLIEQVKRLESYFGQLDLIEYAEQEEG